MRATATDMVPCAVFDEIFQTAWGDEDPRDAEFPMPNATRMQLRMKYSELCDRLWQNRKTYHTILHQRSPSSIAFKNFALRDLIARDALLRQHKRDTRCGRDS